MATLLWKTAAVLVVVAAVIVAGDAAAPPRRILLDADMDKDDFFALLYLLKQNRSEFELEVGELSTKINFTCSYISSTPFPELSSPVEV
ncbi:hypothetical protein EJB05_35484, partial [Eragrostis curvula]